MKKLYSFMIPFLIVIQLFSGSVFATSDVEEMQAVWMATVYNIDFPSVKMDAEAQKAEFIEKLDAMQALGINTVMVQVRPKADALYRSAINPWSDVLTGTQGTDPGYDPLAFMVEETHKRGMALHAWLNPYRVTTSGTDVYQLAENHSARINPSWVMAYDNALYYNPSLDAVKEHIVDSVEEIVLNYDVDGIVFDDYFYPSSYPLPMGETRDGAVADERRNHINDMVERVHIAVENTRENVLFGISPSGIWKNSSSDPTGSETAGNESYYSVYADTRSWIKNEWIDYVSPQIYWEIGHRLADYQTLVGWWANEVRETDVNLLISHGVYREVVAQEIGTQLALNQNYPEVDGSIYYNLKHLLADTGACKAQIASFNGNNVFASVGSSGYVPSRSGDATTGHSTETGIVTAQVLNVRSGAGQQYTILDQVSRGTQVRIIDEALGWYKIEWLNGNVGWVSQDYIRQ